MKFKIISRAALVMLPFTLAACSAPSKASAPDEPNDQDAGAVGNLGACNPSPPTPSEGSRFCAELARRQETPGSIGRTACTSKAAHCAAYEGNLSDEFKSNYIDCSRTSPFCAANEFQTCQTAALAKSAPTAAQSKVAEDYCVTCRPDARANCAAKFFSDPDGELGPGFGVLAASDRLAESIRQECTGAKLFERYKEPVPPQGFAHHACQSFFVLCADAVGRETPPPQACR